MAIQDEIPKSRLTLRYETEVNGQLEDMTLPLRLLITGDFSQGTSSDRTLDLDERRIRNLDGKNTDSVMKDMGMTLNFSVENKIDADMFININDIYNINSSSDIIVSLSIFCRRGGVEDEAWMLNSEVEV